MIGIIKAELNLMVPRPVGIVLKGAVSIGKYKLTIHW